MPTKARQTGMTLVELVISIVILSIAVVGVFSALGTTVGRSVDPMIRGQSIAIAEAYLEEITQRQFGEIGADCPAEPGGGTRADYSHICHFDGLNDTGAVDQYGASIDELANYDVTVAISNSSNLGGLDSSVVLRIDINVTGPTNETFTLSGYRTP
ncbi:MAG: type II secretion system protein [Gammaproteobacteria bacterium]|nr:type II secretion system protein [Gammaproteobacteria bacterium]